MKYSSVDAGRFRTVRVFDPGGSEQIPTYPKRAKGLIKNGRAQWLSEDSIVLIEEVSLHMTVSDDKLNKSEDKIMSELNKDITVAALLERLESLGASIAGADNTDIATVSSKLYISTLDVIKDIKKQNQEVILAELSAGAEIVCEADETQTSLLTRLEELGGALAGCQEIELAIIVGNVYTETINVIKDIAKQNQEIKLAQLKAAK